MQCVINEETPLRHDDNYGKTNDKIVIQISPGPKVVDQTTGVIKNDEIDRFSPLLPELKIKIAAYLDFKSLPKLSQIDRKTKDFVDNTWSIQIKAHQIYNLIPYPISKWVALPMTCNNVGLSTICSSWLTAIGAMGGVIGGIYTSANLPAAVIGGIAIGNGISLGSSTAISAFCWGGTWRDTLLNNYKPLISGILIGDILALAGMGIFMGSFTLPLWAGLTLSGGTAFFGPFAVAGTLKKLGLYCEKHVNRKEVEIDIILHELKTSEENPIPEENLQHLEYTVKKI